MEKTNLLLSIVGILVFSTTLSADPEAEELLGLPFEKLLDVMITSVSKKPEKLANAPATATVITDRQIRERGYQYLDQALRDLPGFDFVQVHGTYPTIWAQRGIYGDENKRMLVFVDGIVENNILEGSVLGGPQYSLHNVERIEIIWGPASALYGANAFTGIVNIITRKGKNIDGFEYYKGFGSYDSRYDKFTFGKEIKGVDFVVSGSLYDSDGPTFKYQHPNYNRSHVDNAYSLTARLGYKNTKIGFNKFSRPMGFGLFANAPAVQMYGLPPYGYQNNEGTEGGLAPSNVNGEKGTRWESYVQTMFLKHKFEINDQSLLNATIHYKESGIKEGSYQYIFNKEHTAYDKYSYGHESDAVVAELQFNHDFDKNQDIAVGIQYDRSNVERGYRERVWLDPSQLNNSKVSGISVLSKERVYDIYQNKAAYAQYRLRTKFFNDTSFIFGIRYDDNNVYGEVTNPRIGAVIKPNEKLTVKTLYGSAYKAPSSFDLYTTSDKRISNPNLVPERVDSLELNLGYKFTDDFLFESSFFQNKFTDIITSNVDVGDVDNDGESETQNQNKGSVNIKGFELRTDFRLQRDITGFLNYSYQSTEQSDGEGNTFPVANVAKHKANVGINYLIDNRFNIGLTGNWVGDRQTALTNPRDTVDGYFLTNLTLSTTDVLHENFNISLSVHNLFKEHYAEPGIRVADGTYYPTQNQQPGRSAFLTFGLSF